MRASVVRRLGGGFAVEEVQLAQPIGREVVVAVKASGLCHSDLSFSLTDMNYPLPMVLGHELAGVVVEVGPDVTEFAVGDHAVGCTIRWCGRCEACIDGRVYQCEEPSSVLRLPTDAPRISTNGERVSQVYGLGGFAQQALVHENQLVKVPIELPFAQAALLGCGVVTGAGAVLNAADIRAGQTVVIVGAGGVGLNAVTGAVLAGAGAIIVIDISAEKLHKASLFGATHTINSALTDPVAEVIKISRIGAHAVFDFVGITAVMQQGLDMLRTGGVLYLIALTDAAVAIPLRLGDLRKQKRVQNVYVGSSVPKRDIPLYAELYLQGRFRLDELVSRQISLEQVNEGFAALTDPTVTRVVITSGLS